MWFGALRPAGLRRAAAWDGWIAVALGEDGSSVALTPEDLERRAMVIGEERERLGLGVLPYDVAVLGASVADEPSAAEYVAAGATWWFESLSPMRGSVDALEAIVRAGPPR